jgi:hypothetical protein
MNLDSRFSKGRELTLTLLRQSLTKKRGFPFGNIYMDGSIYGMGKKYKAVAEHLSCELNGESVILNMKNGKYYGVNTVGSSIWAAIQIPVSFEEVHSALMSEYEVDEATCSQAVRSFLEKMAKEDLVDILDEKNS